MRFDWFMVWILFNVLNRAVESCSSSSSDDEYRVIRKTDGNGKQVVIAVGETARLICQVNVPWKKCMWKPPRNGVRELKCEFGKDANLNWGCPSFPEVHFDREASTLDTCGIIVQNISEHHTGNWRCEFEVEVPSQEKPVMIKDKVKVMARGWRYP